MADAWTCQPTLSGAHVTLRPMVAADRNAIVAAASDGRLWELFYTGVPSEETIDAYLENAAREASFGRAMPYVVVDTASGRVVGATRFMRMNKAALRLEIGTTFYAQSAQRTPINTEAKLLLLTQAFGVMGCNCVQLRTDHFNHVSQRAIERLGAKRDGVLRNHNVMDGRVRDTVVYSILANEWPGVQRNLNFRLSRSG
jgi:RimJ/RimL family protein N-acetyltransferase